MGFEKKVIWITGASSGIGEALVKEFANRNAIIVLSARRKELLENVQRSNNLNQTNSLILPFDLENTDKASEWVKLIIEKFGRIDMLINNGGFSQRSYAVDTQNSLERKIMEVDYFSYTQLSKAVLPYFLKQKSGQIVVVSSIAGKFGFYMRSSYSAAKHALHGYFETLRLETEDVGIKILIVCPGKIKTNISMNAVTDIDGKHNKIDPSHKDAMSAEECAVQIIKAIENGKEEILIGRKELMMVHIKRYFPRLFSYLVRRVKRD